MQSFMFYDKIMLYFIQKKVIITSQANQTNRGVER